MYKGVNVHTYNVSLKNWNSFSLILWLQKQPCPLRSLQSTFSLPTSRSLDSLFEGVSMLKWCPQLHLAKLNWRRCRPTGPRYQNTFTCTRAATNSTTSKKSNISSTIRLGEFRVSQMRLITQSIHFRLSVIKLFSAAFNFASKSSLRVWFRFQKGKKIFLRKDGYTIPKLTFTSCRDLIFWKRYVL